MGCDVILPRSFAHQRGCVIHREEPAPRLCQSRGDTPLLGPPPVPGGDDTGTVPASPFAFFFLQCPPQATARAPHRLGRAPAGASVVPAARKAVCPLPRNNVGTHKELLSLALQITTRDGRVFKSSL